MSQRLKGMMYVHGIIAVMLEIHFLEFVLNLWCNKYPIPLSLGTATVHTGNGILRHYLLGSGKGGLSFKSHSVTYFVTLTKPLAFFIYKMGFSYYVFL